MKRKSKRSRLEGVIAKEQSQQVRQELARYGKKVPLIWIIEYWHNRLKNDAVFREQGKLPDDDRGRWLAKLIIPIIKLDDKWFDQVASAIREYKARKEPSDPMREKLSDFYLWLANPPLTVRQIAKRIGYNRSDDFRHLRRMLRALEVPHSKADK